MQDLLDKIVAEANVTPDQAAKTLDVIKEYIVEKFPMLGGAVENLLGGNN